MSESPVIVWYRRDLRIQDNLALNAALQREVPVIAVYIHDEPGEGRWKSGRASLSWLHYSLLSLADSFKEKKSELLIFEGDSLTVLNSLIAKTGATSVYWNRRYEPEIIKRDSSIKTELSSQGIDVKSFNGSLLHEPHTIANKSGLPFQVFSPFWKHCLTLDKDAAVECTTKVFKHYSGTLKGVKIETLGLLPDRGWDKSFYINWTPGEVSARDRLKKFLSVSAAEYKDQRNFPAVAGTSGMSPHLHFGEISPRQIWKACLGLVAGDFSSLNRGITHFISEVGWREFAYHLLFHFPHTPTKALRSEFNHFPWNDDAAGLKAWKKGMTGYPIVDAGMRELWTTGWMHNRVRMIVGSFLVKDLLLDWREGADWFWDKLIDADLASNTMGWQWVSGSGADAAPYFRIFNPILQAQKFDAEGVYIRKWVPEISKLPNTFLHQPWTAPLGVLESAGIKLGRDYPKPIVDHGEARYAALEALKKIKKA